MTVDVVIVTHRRDSHVEFLNDALDSVKAQSLGPERVFVVSDVEDKEGHDTVMKQAASDLDLEFICWNAPEQYLSDSRAGGRAPASRNFGIYRSNADWIAFLDDDDWWEPAYLEKSMELGARSKSDVVVSHTTTGKDKRWRKCYDGEFSERRFFVSNPGVNGSNLLFRRHSLIEIGGYNPAVLGSADKEVMIRLIRNGGKAAVLDEALVYHRTHAGQDSVNMGRLEENAKALMKIHGRSMGIRTRLEMLGKILRLRYAKSQSLNEAKKV